MARLHPRCDWLAIWILWSAWCSLAGWILSGLNQLDRAGYAAGLVLFLVGITVARRFLADPRTRRLFLARRSTYCRLLPKLWLALTLLALAGGLFYHPDNYDYLTYRFPRLLHWTWVHHWYWIDTPNDRQNLSSVGMEWLMAPLFVLFRTDRLFFLINFVSYLFMPGLVFSVFRGLGISGRVAWWWMWTLPAGFCFILQSASMGNDAFAAVYLLAAIHYALKARAGSPVALALSILSIALTTGTKASNIPLVVPLLAVFWLYRRPLLAAVRPAFLVLVCVIGAVISIFPVACNNFRFSGSFEGDPLDDHHVKISQPLAGIAGNTLELVGDNLAPPVWPHPLHWPVPARLVAAIKTGYPRFELVPTPLQFEESAGLGLGVTTFALLCLAYGFKRGLTRRPLPLADPKVLILAVTTLIAWLGYMSKLGSEAIPRLVAAYYVISLASLFLIFPVPGPIIHRRLWRGWGYAALLLAFPLLVLNPSRPLLPARWIAACLRAGHVPASAVTQLEDIYRMRGDRRDSLNLLRQAIPPGERIIGTISEGDDPEVSLWIPFGSREVIEVYPMTTDLAARHIHYVAVSAEALQTKYHTTLAKLLKKWSMTVVGQQEVLFKSSRKTVTWYLIRSS